MPPKDERGKKHRVFSMSCSKYFKMIKKSWQQLQDGESADSLASLSYAFVAIDLVLFATCLNRWATQHGAMWEWHPPFLLPQLGWLHSVDNVALCMFWCINGSTIKHLLRALCTRKKTCQPLALSMFSMFSNLFRGPKPLDLTVSSVSTRGMLGDSTGSFHFHCHWPPGNPKFRTLLMSCDGSDVIQKNVIWYDTYFDTCIQYSGLI